MRKFIIFLLISFCLGQSVSFMRFYANEHDFMADNRMMASLRFSKPYLQVFYNNRKQPIIKEWVDISGEVTRREYLEYADGNNIFRQFFLNTEQRPDSLIQFGMDEPWSVEFRKVLPEKIHLP